MIKFTTTLLKFGSKGEKTGWTYIEISYEQAKILKPFNRKSFRVKGMLDNYRFAGVALLPMGEGGFIMAINATMRKAIKKEEGDNVVVELSIDNAPFILEKDFQEALRFEKTASAFFWSLPKSHQRYFNKWIESAKTKETKFNRIAKAILALERKHGYGEMLRDLKKTKT
jgi:hypothetical protein